VQLVARGRDKADVETAAREIEELVRELGVEPARVNV
jgi:hypothetical protein